MFQVKTDLHGKSIQSPTGTFWMSPQRDIRSAFPVYVIKALDMIDKLRQDKVIKNFFDTAVDPDAQLMSLADVMANFVKLASDGSKSVTESAKECGWYELSVEVVQVFSYALATVTMSAYFAGLRESKSSSYIPFLFGGPEQIAGCIVK